MTQQLYLRMRSGIAGDAVAIGDGEEGAEFFQDDAFALGAWSCQDGFYPLKTALILAETS
jgi:hypothetical protein